MNSWKTTTAGILAMVAAVATVVAAYLDGDPATSPDFTSAAGAFMTGLGLLVARDNDKSSEKGGAK